MEHQDKVLMYNFGDCFSPHLEIQSDIIQQHLDRDDDVLRVVCNNELPRCFVNPEHQLRICTYCNARTRAADSLLRPRVKSITYLRLEPHQREIIREFRFTGQTLSQLKALHYDNFDIGMAVASMMIDSHRDAELDVAEHLSEINEWLGISLAVYLSARTIIDQENAKKVYLFNGRRCIYKAVLRACEFVSVDYAVLDGHPNVERHTEINNRLLHHIQFHHRDVELLWKQADKSTREKMAHRFYHEQENGLALINFVGDQMKDHLPHTWSNDARNITIFISSEFELAAAGNTFDLPFYANQSDGIMQIVDDVERSDSNIHIYIRIHPHLKNDNNKFTRALKAISSPCVTIIPAESPVSSYALIASSEKVVCFGSTVGIEAAYRGKPSILLGPSFYGQLGSTYSPKSHAEVMELIYGDVKPLPILGALKYAYHQLNHGRKNIYAERESTWKTRFKGKYLDDVMRFWWRLAVRISNSRIGDSRLAAWLSHKHQNTLNSKIGITH